MNLDCEVSGEGPPIALLHGFTTSGRAWADIAARLANRFRVIAVDLPGHGRSPAPPRGYDFTACADDVLAAVQRHGRTPTTLLGYSMGGRIALAATLRAPTAVSRLILESASPGLATTAERVDRRTADAALAKQIESGGWAAFVERWLAQPLFRGLESLDAETRARQRAIRLDNEPAAVAAALRRLGTGSQPSYWQRLGEVRQPVLLITGERDDKFAAIAARMLAALPAAERCVIAAAGHTTHAENPAAFTAAVIEFATRPLDTGASPAAPAAASP